MEKYINSELMKSKLKQIKKTYKDVADATGLSYSIVEKVFSGRRFNPTSRVLMAICKFLEVEIEEITLNPSELNKSSNNVFLKHENKIEGYTLNQADFDTIQLLLKKFTKI